MSTVTGIARATRDIVLANRRLINRSPPAVIVFFASVSAITLWHSDSPHEAEAHNIGGRIQGNFADLILNTDLVECTGGGWGDYESLSWAGVEWWLYGSYPANNYIPSVGYVPAFVATQPNCNTWNYVTFALVGHTDWPGGPAAYTDIYGYRSDGSWGSCNGLFCPTINAASVVLNRSELPANSLYLHQTLVHELGHVLTLADFGGISCTGGNQSIMNASCLPLLLGYHTPLAHDVSDLAQKY